MLQASLPLLQRLKQPGTTGAQSNGWRVVNGTGEPVPNIRVTIESWV
jgi:hypothetical protein